MGGDRTTAGRVPGRVRGRLPYRPDIDGLRALAVALVIGYHFGIPGFGGGYLGVDLFFVVSGFLIAAILDSEATITWPVLAGFFDRRIKRLMPAFIVVAVVTTAAATLLLLPDDYTAFLKSVRESFEFKSNVYFERETTGYFATDASTLPWLHTWSLAIEWQFYGMFPALVLVLRLVPSPRARQVALFVLVAIGVALSAWMTAAQPAHAYFSPIARAFEFLLGAATATWRLPALRPRTAIGVSVAGIAVLVTLANVFERTTPFPGLDAFWVCAVGVALLATGHGGSLLAHPTLAAIGKRSYSAYLWHWPVVALLAYLQAPSSPWRTALWIVAIGCASACSYRLVERPGIALRWRLPATLAVFCVLPLAAFTIANLLARTHEGWPGRLGAEAGRVQATLRRFEMPGRERCHDFKGGDLEACAFGDRSASRRALLIGDSHARHFEPFLDVMARAMHVKVYGLTDTECLALQDVRLPRQFATAAACATAIERDLSHIRADRFDFVVLADRWIGYPADQVAKLDATLATIVASGAIPVVFRPGVEDGSDPKRCFDRHIKMRVPLAESCAIAQDNGWSREARQRTNVLIDAMKVRHPTLRVVDPQAVQCRDAVCRTIIDGTPIYSDTHHLDAFGSTMLARDYLQQVGNPFEADAGQRNPPRQD